MRDRRPLTIDGPMGGMVLTVLGMIAEMEPGFICDRQRKGVEAAKANGVYKAVPPLSSAAASSHCARKGWAPRKSLGLSAAGGATTLKAAGLDLAGRIELDREHCRGSIPS
jgi:hypothetical protein